VEDLLSNSQEKDFLKSGTAGKLVHEIVQIWPLIVKSLHYARLTDISVSLHISLICTDSRIAKKTAHGIYMYMQIRQLYGEQLPCYWEID
jgi:hypothetical protein